MMLFLSLFVLVLAAASPSDGQELKLQRGNCPTFWFSFKGRCYKYVATHLSWADAELYCLSEKTNLVSIRSKEEHEFVNSLINNFDHSQGETWIGLSDIHKEGRWMWSDGSVVKFVFWASGEPNNKGKSEHCVHTSFAKEKKWNDSQCSGRFPSVCASRIYYN